MDNILKIKTEIKSINPLYDRSSITTPSPLKVLQYPRKSKFQKSPQTPVQFKISKLLEDLEMQIQEEKKQNIQDKIKSWIVDMCKCYDYCYPNLNLEQLPKKQKFQCISIDVDINQDYVNKYREIMDSALTFMVENKYIEQIGSIYYIILNDTPTYRLTWENIKELLYIDKDNKF